MVGPFMQGMLLMGIIYWYSKGLINMINDYYRGEFNRKLKHEINEQKIALNKAPSYDLSDMEQLVDMAMREDKLNKADEQQPPDFTDTKEQYNFNFTALDKMSYCYRLDSKQEFLNILFTIVYNYYKMHPFKNPICALNENKNISMAYSKMEPKEELVLVL